MKGVSENISDQGFIKQFVRGQSGSGAGAAATARGPMRVKRNSLKFQKTIDEVIPRMEIVQMSERFKMYSV